MTINSYYENKIVRFYFLLHQNNISESSRELHFLLKTMKYDLQKGDITVYIYLRTLYEMIGHTRDLYFGRGERDLSYMMIFVWHSYFPVLAFYAFHRLVIPIQDGLYTYPSFGCWKDVKYFCKYVLKESSNIHHPLIESAVSLANWQLKRDKDTNSIGKISNVAKWIPRETKEPLLYEQFVLNWYDYDGFGNRITRGTSCQNMNETMPAAISFMKKKYRTMISNICKQQAVSTKAPMANTNHRACKRSNKSQNEIINGMGRNYMYDTIFVGEYVKMAVQMYESGDSSGREWLNQKWNYLKKVMYFKRRFSAIPIIDMSIDISNQDLFHAIGFACLIAELFGTYRILLASSVPIWLDISDSKDFYERVHKIWLVCKFRGESIVSRALDLVFTTLDKTSVGGGSGGIDSSSMCFFIFSQEFCFDWENLAGRIRPGIRFVFWKIGSTGNDIKRIPEFRVEEPTEIMYVSGNSACLLKTCIEEIPDYHDYIYRFMNCSRYACLTQYFDNFWDNLQVSTDSVG